MPKMQESCLDPQIDEFFKQLSVAWLGLRVKTFKELPVGAEKKSHATDNCLRNWF